MKFENTQVWGFEHALRGMRNAKNSWNKADSFFGIIDDYDQSDFDIGEEYVNKYNLDLVNDENFDEIAYENKISEYADWLVNQGILESSEEYYKVVYIGPNDMKLAQTLIKAGPEHRKFLRQIFVSVDITAPLYIWKEFDTYKVGTVANSTSTMHTIQNKPITLDCFEIDDYYEVRLKEDSMEADETFHNSIINIIHFLEKLRQKYLETKDKKYWKELIRWLPESWLQTRTVTMNYENLLNICSRGQRRFHKLNEWSGVDNPALENFVKWARTLPYAQEFIFIDEDASNIHK